MTQVKRPEPNGLSTIVRHPRLVFAVVLAGLMIHPSAIATALFGFAVAIVVAEAIDYALRGR